MSKDLMREQFEAAWRARYPAHGDIALKRSGLDPEDYCNTRVKDAWWAWKASREAVVVDLPNPADYGVYNDHSDFLHVDDVELMKAVRAAIEAQGLKVAP